MLDLVDKGLVSDQIVLTVGYDIENLTDPEISKKYKGDVTTDFYGRKVPKHAHGTANIGSYTSSTKLIIDAVTELYERIVDRGLLIRRLNITANRVIPESEAKNDERSGEQMNMFVDYDAIEREKEEENARLAREKSMQKTVIDIKKRYGKNAIIKGMNLEDGATATERNSQIGGHKA